jgi:hypothetical protein
VQSHNNHSQDITGERKTYDVQKVRRAQEFFQINALAEQKEAWDFLGGGEGKAYAFSYRKTLKG